MDRQACDYVKQIQESNTYLMGLLLWLGFEPVTLYYHRRRREQRYGRSMWTFVRKLKYLIDAFVAFSYAPVRFASILGFVLSSLGLAYALLVILLNIFWQVRIEGWTSLMVVVLVVSGTQMVILGILGEYLWRNLDETRRRPRFIIDRVDEHLETDASARDADQVDTNSTER